MERPSIIFDLKKLYYCTEIFNIKLNQNITSSFNFPLFPHPWDSFLKIQKKYSIAYKNNPSVPSDLLKICQIEKRRIDRSPEFLEEFLLEITASPASANDLSQKFRFREISSGSSLTKNEWFVRFDGFPIGSEKPRRHQIVTVL